MIPLPVLPFAPGDLEPAMSRDTLSFHFSRHHIDHYERTLALARHFGLADRALEDLVRESRGSRRLAALHRHAAEACNHDCFWRSMRIGGGGPPRGAIAVAIDERFGDYRRFVRRFTGAAASVFGNGWLWLTWYGGRLRIVATRGCETPLVRGHTILLALDLWEHAYYLDHQNRRAAYIRVFLEELVDWETADAALGGCLAVAA